MDCWHHYPFLRQGEREFLPKSGVRREERSLEHVRQTVNTSFRK